MNQTDHCPDVDTVTISTERERLDIDLIYGFLTRSYWAEGIPKEIVERSIRHSLCFGAFSGTRQIGFARVMTDRATFAYLADVFVIEEFRGRGVGTKLMGAIMAHPDLQGLRRWSLLTRDAQGLYRKFGFAAPVHPERYMEIANPGIYRKSTIKVPGND